MKVDEEIRIKMAQCEGWESTGFWPNGEPHWDANIKRDGFSTSGNIVVQIPTYDNDNDLDRFIRGMGSPELIRYGYHLRALVKLAATDKDLCQLTTHALQARAAEGQKLVAIIRAKGWEK